MGTGESNAGGNPAMDWHPIQGEVEILLVASCYEGRTGGGLSHGSRTEKTTNHGSRISKFHFPESRK